MSVQQLTSSNFDEKTKSGVTLVDFWAPWCGPCRALTPIIEEVEQEMGDKVTVAKVNCDDEASLAEKFEVRSIPAIFILKNGETVDQFVGVQSKQDLVTALDKALA